ncbi:hypothetical protein FACS1894176_05860 [Bacteroidia bacterium]|nr:hypothetical protein FACS1894176_05860 [Bacteroidia bacterium]
MKKHLIFSLLFFAAVASMHAQVTIGSTANPTDGAVLDLSRSGSLGLILPHAALDNTTHYQLGTTYAGAEIYTDGTGTVVYNDGTGTLQPAGIYVWNGTDWLAFSSGCPLGDPQSLNIIVSPRGLIAAGSTSNGNYPSGTPVTATVTLNANQVFDNWYANGVRIEDPAAALATYNLCMPDSEDLILHTYFIL